MLYFWLREGYRCKKNIYIVLAQEKGYSPKRYSSPLFCNEKEQGDNFDIDLNF